MFAGHPRRGAQLVRADSIRRELAETRPPEPQGFNLDIPKFGASERLQASCLQNRRKAAASGNALSSSLFTPWCPRLGGRLSSHTLQRLPRGLCMDQLPPPLPGQGLSDCTQLPGHEQDLQTLGRAVVEGWVARGGGFCLLPPSLPPSPLPYSKGFHTLFYPDDIFSGQEVAPFYRQGN